MLVKKGEGEGLNMAVKVVADIADGLLTYFQHEAGGDVTRHAPHKIDADEGHRNQFHHLAVYFDKHFVQQGLDEVSDAPGGAGDYQHAESGQKERVSIRLNVM
jgi:hypothetical protein